jgi:hypothetical protein
MGRIDLNVNPVHIRFRNKSTGKMRWMRCREYQIHGDRVSVTSVKKGHQLSEWFSLSEWEIEKTDAPEGTSQPVSAPPPDAFAVLTATPRGTENPNAPKSLAEAIARRDDPRKTGNLTAELPGEMNAWAHVDRADPMKAVTSDPVALINLKASIAAESTRQEAMLRMQQIQAKRKLMAGIEVRGVGFE